MVRAEYVEGKKVIYGGGGVNPSKIMIGYRNGVCSIATVWYSQFLPFYTDDPEVIDEIIRTLKKLRRG